MEPGSEYQLCTAELQCINSCSMVCSICMYVYVYVRTLTRLPHRGHFYSLPFRRPLCVTLHLRGCILHNTKHIYATPQWVLRNHTSHTITLGQVVEGGAGMEGNATSGSGSASMKTGTNINNASSMNGRGRAKRRVLCALELQPEESLPFSCPVTAVHHMAVFAHQSREKTLSSSSRVHPSSSPLRIPHALRLFDLCQVGHHITGYTVLLREGLMEEHRFVVDIKESSGPLSQHSGGGGGVRDPPRVVTFLAAVKGMKISCKPLICSIPHMRLLPSCGLFVSRNFCACAFST